MRHRRGDGVGESSYPRRTSRLFPDLPLVQARLEKYLLRPKDDILRMAKNAVRSAGGCAVGVYGTPTPGAAL